MNTIFLKNIMILWFVLVLGGVVTFLYADDQHYDRLLDRSHFAQLDKTTAYRMQSELAIIYQNNQDWQKDVALSRHPLTDGIIGPVTLFWLQRFAYDFKIEPIGEYVDELVQRLAYIAEFTQMFPEHTEILLSSDFDAWNDLERSLQRDRDYAIRRIGSRQALLDLVYRYQLIADPASIDVVDGDGISSVSYYQLTAEDFELLQSKERILAELLKLENKLFENISLLQQAVSDVLQAYPALLRRLLPMTKQYFADKPLVITKDYVTELNKEMMSSSLMTSLNKMIAGLLEKEIAGNTYPTKALFEKAAQAVIQAGIGACYTTKLHNQYVLNLKIDDEDFQALEEDLLNNPKYHGMPNIHSDLDWIKRLRQRPENCIDDNKKIVDAFVRTLYQQVVHPAITLLYKKKPVYDPAVSVQWDGGGCGCVLDKLSGVVYGFYPFWRADNSKQAINFSVINRIAYYGLTFDQGGAIRHTNDVKNKFDIKQFLKNNRFVQTARKHNSQVDWVIYKDSSYWENIWKHLNSKQKASVFAALAKNVFQLLTSPLDHSYAKWLLDVLPLSTQGDGVTFDFRNYPRDEESINLFNNFYDELSEKLAAANGDYFINIVAPQSELGQGIYGYPNLLERITGIQPGVSSYQQIDITADLNAKILVLLEEPTTSTKKALRLDVESAELYGVLRGLLLRNLIPVIEFDGRNWGQLENDLVYFKDNFGGVGFWPMPIDEPAVPTELAGHCDDIKTISGCLTRHFQIAERNGQPDSWLDQLVCENRLLFTVILTVLTLLSLILLVIYQYSCRVHGKHQNIYIIGMYAAIIPTLIIAMLLLMFDPVLESLSEGNIPLIIVVTIGVLASFIYFRRQQSKAKKPSRPKRSGATAKLNTYSH